MSTVLIEAKGLSVSHGHPLHKRGCYVDVTLTMDDEQIRNALYGLIRSMPQARAAELLREEFPELLESA